MKKNYLIFFILFVSFSTKVFSQFTPSFLIDNTDVVSGFNYQSWNIENSVPIKEFVVPLSLVTLVNRDFTIVASTNTAYASLGSNDNIFGFTDTRISGTYITVENKLLLSGGIAIPTGKTSLQQDQVPIASAIAQYPLNFRIPSYGQGLTINGSVSYALDLKGIILSAGIGGVYRKGFKPLLNSDFVYKPGSEFSVSAGTELMPGGRNGTKLDIDASYTFYGADTYGGTEVLKSGRKLILNVRSVSQINNFGLLIFLRERTKGKNEFGSGVLQLESKNSNGNQLDAGTTGTIAISRVVAIKSLVELNYYSKNEYQENGAFITGVGAGINLTFSRSFLFNLQYKYLFGSLRNKNSSTQIDGYGISGDLRFNL